MLRYSLENISAAHLSELVENGVEESRTLDFKEDYGAIDGRKRNLNNDAKRELLADISAFANTDGGDIIIGVRDVAGKAIEIIGLDLEDPDSELLKIQNIIRDLLEPRITGILVRAVPIDGSRVVLIIRTPRSWIAPHRVKVDNKFFARNSSGKYPMDVTELRQAFTLGEIVTERIKRFRSERVEIIERGETPFALLNGPLAIFHIVALSSFTALREILFERNAVDILPPNFDGGGLHTRFCLEGKAYATGAVADGGLHRGYGLLFRNGIIEAVEYIGHYNKQTNYVYASEIEGVLVKSIPAYLDRLGGLGIEAPYYLFVTLIDVQGLPLNFGQHESIRETRNYAPTPKLFLPEVTIAGEYKLDEAKKISDLVHNAFGLSRSHGFSSSSGTLRWRG